MGRNMGTRRGLASRSTVRGVSGTSLHAVAERGENLWSLGRFFRGRRKRDTRVIELFSRAAAQQQVGNDVDESDQHHEIANRHNRIDDGDGNDVAECAERGRRLGRLAKSVDVCPTRIIDIADRHERQLRDRDCAIEQNRGEIHQHTNDHDDHAGELEVLDREPDEADHSRNDPDDGERRTQQVDDQHREDREYQKSRPVKACRSHA